MFEISLFEWHETTGSLFFDLMTVFHFLTHTFPLCAVLRLLSEYFNYRINMLTLSGLPVEILAEIFSGPNSWMAIMMWKTGDSLLRRKMALGGVRRLHLCMIRSAIVQRKWPQCLGEFRQLIELRYSTYHDLAWSNVTPMLQSLSETIEHLELDGGGAVSILLCHTIPTQSEATAPSYRHHTPQQLTLDPSSTSHFRFASQFPRLRLLSLQQRNPLPNTIYAAPLESLPSSLTSLSINAIIYHFPYELNFQGMPKVSSLSLTSNLLNGSNILNIPSRESILSLQVWNDDLWETLVSCPQILPNLQVPPWVDYDCTDVEDASDDEGMKDHRRQLMPNIRSLSRYDGIDEDFLWRTWFPPRLTTLQLDHGIHQDNAGSFAPIDGKWICTVMPRTVTRFIVSAIDWKEITADIWPPQLRTFKHHYADFVDSRLFHRLPRTLTHLTLWHGVIDGEVTSITNVPMTSSEIDQVWQSGRDALSMEIETWTQTKAWLLRRCKSEPECNWSEYVAQIEKGALFGLPTSLTEMDLITACSHNLMGFLLPPNLVTFNFMANDLIKDYNFWTHLPPRLIDFESHLRPMSMMPSPFAALHSARFIVYLKLTFEKHTFPNLIQGVLGGQLPPNLRYLSLSSYVATLVQVDSLNLPSRLETLHFHGINIQPVNAWLHALPRTLTKLDAAEAHGADLCNLPPHLTSGKLILQSLTFEQLWGLPRSLNSFNVVGMVSNKFFIKFYPFYTLWDESEQVRLEQWNEAHK